MQMKDLYTEDKILLKENEEINKWEDIKYSCIFHHNKIHNMTKYKFIRIN